MAAWDELIRRIAFTLGALLLYRVGCHIPIPGTDPQVWDQIFAAGTGSALTNANAASGGAIAHLSIFALGLTPYIAAAVLMQVASVVFGGLRELTRRGEDGRRAFRRATLIVAIILATVQGLGVASALQRVGNLVASPGGGFVATATLTFVGGTLVLAWLAEQITRRGIGNGIAVILLTAIALDASQAVFAALQLNNLGVFSPEFTVALGLLTVVLVLVIVVVERGRYTIALQFAARRLGEIALPQVQGALEFKINTAGLLPAFVAPWFLYLPLTLLALTVGVEEPWLRAVVQALQVGQLGHMAFNTVVTLVLVFIYTAAVIDPDHIAERLRSYGGTVPGIAPGEATADHVDRIVSRMTLAGGLYLALIVLIPELLIAYAKVPFNLGGASALIAVGAILDIDAQVRSLWPRRTNHTSVGLATGAGG